jgi:predicted ATPase
VTDVADACVLRELFAAEGLRHTAVVWTSNRAPAGLYSGGLNQKRIAPFVKALTTHHRVVDLDRSQVQHRRPEPCRPLRSERVTDTSGACVSPKMCCLLRRTAW